MVCPSCLGAKSVMAIIDRRGAAGMPTGSVERVPCRVCGGSGEISEELAAAIHAGEQLRAERLARGETMREAATARGISVVEYSKLERGL